MTGEPDSGTIQEWLRRCCGHAGLRLLSASPAGGYSGTRTWECEVTGAGSPGHLVLKLYRPGFDDYSGLGPIGTARKHALALAELSGHGIPTPRCLGFASTGDEAAIAMARVVGSEWAEGTRAEAARVLATLHGIRTGDLSPELAELVSRSTPNRGRVGETAGEPPLAEETLQHGDYFSANIAATGKGICVLDWDLLALGDPMWDLGFLLEADRGVDVEEASGAIRAYRAVRAFDKGRLRWQRACWRAYWRGRRLSDAV